MNHLFLYPAGGGTLPGGVPCRGGTLPGGYPAGGVPCRGYPAEGGGGYPAGGGTLPGGTLLRGGTLPGGVPCRGVPCWGGALLGGYPAEGGTLGEGGGVVAALPGGGLTSVVSKLQLSSSAVSWPYIALCPMELWVMLQSIMGKKKNYGMGTPPCGQTD